MNIFVAKLSYNTTEDQLQSAFEQFGTVDSVKIIMDKFEGRSKGYGFVEMSDDGEGQAAIDSLNESEIDGRQIVVKKARPKSDNGGGRRGGGGYGGGGGNRGGGGYGGGGGNRGGGGYGGGGGGNRY